jgi:bifunctional DNase/RNase
MTLMRVLELTSCSRHNRALILLEDVEGTRRLTFYADGCETHRLAHALARGPRACHPVFDFVRALLETLGASPARVVLEDVDGQGIGALVHVRQGASEVTVTCYPPDAIALAVRERLPIYATPGALDHAEPVPPPVTGAGAVSEWLDRVQPQDFET